MKVRRKKEPFKRGNTGQGHETSQEESSSSQSLTTLFPYKAEYERSMIHKSLYDYTNDPL